jgi:hypothetical protein
MASPKAKTSDAAEQNPLAVTVQRACELSGLGPTSIWAFLKDGRLEAVRVPGVRRTLVSYASLARLLAPSPLLQPAESPSGKPGGNARARVGKAAEQVERDGSLVIARARSSAPKAADA